MKKSAGILILLIAIALGLRVGAIRMLAQAPASDEMEYHQLAVNLLAGHGYAMEAGRPTDSRPPLYPAFLALIYAVFGEDYRIVWYVQAVLNASAVLLTYLLARSLLPEGMALVAAGLMAVHPSFEIVTTLSRENLLIPVLIAFLYALIRLWQTGRKGWVASAGGLAGLLILTNSAFLLLPLAILGVTLFDTRGRRHALSVAMMVAVAGLLWLPWEIRSVQLPADRHDEADLQHFIFVFGHYPVLSGDFWWAVSDMQALEAQRDRARAFVLQREQARSSLNLDQRIAEDRQAVWEQVRAHPAAYAAFVVNRELILLVSPPAGTSVLRRMHPALAELAFAVNVLFVLMGVLGLWFGYRQDASVLPCLAAFVYCLAVYGLIHSTRRYGYVLVPLWCTFGALAVSYLPAATQLVAPQRGEST